MKIVLCYPVESKHRAMIAKAAPEAEIIDSSQQEIADDIFDADIYCGHAKERPIPWDKVVKKGRLKWIQSSAAGMDHCLVPSVVESDITVTSASGVLADQVAEQTLALLLGMARGLPKFIEAQHRREFIRRPTRDLHHSTVGIVGFGGNGRRLAEVLQPFKTRILATDMFPVDKPDYVKELWPHTHLVDLLKQSDYVVLCVPLTKMTDEMISSHTLNFFKNDAFLINVGRGRLIKEIDLCDALHCGQLAGVGLDVTPEEPPANDSPLWSAPRVLITPHVGGQSVRRIDQMTEFFCENLRRWQTGQPLLNYLADKRLGFPIPAAAMTESAKALTSR